VSSGARSSAQGRCSLEEDPGLQHGLDPLQADMPRYVELYLQGRPRLDEMITSSLPPRSFQPHPELDMDGT